MEWKVSNATHSLYQWGCSGVNVLCLGVKKITNITNKLFTYLVSGNEEVPPLNEGHLDKAIHSIHSPAFWLQGLQMRIEEDIHVQRVSELEDRIGFYLGFYERCLENCSFLHPETVLEMIYKKTKERCPTLCLMVLIFLKLRHFREEPQERELTFQQIRSLLLKVDKQDLFYFLLKVRLHMKNEQELVTWNATFGACDKKLLKFVEKAALKILEESKGAEYKIARHRAESKSSPLKLFLAALVLFSQAQKAYAFAEPFFNSTEFWNAAKVQNGTFDVRYQLIKQGICKETDPYCIAPSGLISSAPLTVKEIVNWHWNRVIGVQFSFPNASNPLALKDNSFIDSGVYLSATKTALMLKQSWFQSVYWELGNQSHVIFDSCILSHMQMQPRYQGACALTFNGCQVNEVYFGGNEKTANSTVSLEFLDTSVTQSQFLDHYYLLGGRDTNLTDVEMGSGHIEVFGPGLFKGVSFTGNWDGELTNTTIESSDILDGSVVGLTILNAPLVELTLQPEALLNYTSIVNVVHVKLTRFDQGEAEVLYPLYRPYFQNISHLELFFNHTRVAQPILINVNMSGYWSGRVGPLITCQPKDGMLIAHNVFADNLYLCGVIGGCYPSTSSVKKAKLWWANSNVSFGKNMTWGCYGRVVVFNSLERMLITFGSVLVTAGLISGCIYLGQQCNRRRGYNRITVLNDEKEYTDEDLLLKRID